jgi:hypothetical protein
VESSLILVTRYTSTFTLKCILLNYNQKDRMNFACKQWDPVWNDIAEKRLTLVQPAKNPAPHFLEAIV